MVADALAVLSCHGWDQLGQRGKLIEFRHASTGEIAEVAPAEIAMWAAQLEPEAYPVPEDADWYIEGYIGCFYVVKSKSGKRSGYEHRITPHCTLFVTRKDAEEAVRLLNIRDMQPRQEALW